MSNAVSIFTRPNFARLGIVRALPTEPPLPRNLLVLPNIPGPVLVTRFAIPLEVNMAVQQTIGLPIYIYVFGDKVTEGEITGIAPFSGCINNVGAFNLPIAYYLTNRVNTTRYPIIPIIIGGYSLRTMLKGAIFSSQLPEFGLGSFTFRILILGP